MPVVDETAAVGELITTSVGTVWLVSAVVVGVVVADDPHAAHATTPLQNFQKKLKTLKNQILQHPLLRPKCHCGAAIRRMVG